MRGWRKKAGQINRLLCYIAKHDCIWMSEQKTGINLFIRSFSNDEGLGEK